MPEYRMTDSSRNGGEPRPSARPRHGVPAQRGVDAWQRDADNGSAAWRGSHARHSGNEAVGHRGDREDVLFSASLETLQSEPMLVSRRAGRCGGSLGRGGHAWPKPVIAVVVAIVLIAAIAAVWSQRASGSSGESASQAQSSTTQVADSETAAFADDAQDTAEAKVDPGESPDEAHEFVKHRRNALGAMEQFGGPREQHSNVFQVESFDGLNGACASVPELFQYPSMPAGCEIYSLAAVLTALGVDADPDDIVANQLPFDVQDDDFATAFWGDPYSSGEGMPPAILIAGNAVLEEANASTRLANATGTDFDQLATKAATGSPVLVWTTLDFENPNFDEPLEANSFYYLEHCVVLLGTQGNDVCLMDPTQGYVTVDYQWFKYLYEQCGSMALAIA